MKKKLNSGGLTGSEKKYRALFDNAPIGISVVDVNRKILEANKALEKVISLSSEELTNELYKKRRYVRSDGSELPEDELPSTLSINKGTPVLDVEIGIEAGQKIIAWTQVSAAPVDLPEKCAVVITQDITERKKLESRLIASEKKYRTFFDNSLDAILITSPNGAIHSANNAACKMLGREEEEICRIGRSGIVEQTPELIEALGRRRATGTFYGELSFIRKNGTRFPVEITSSIFFDSEGSELTTIIARDITERKKTEKALQESEKRYRTLFENSLMGISVVSPEGRLLHANKAYARMYGYESPESMTERVTNVGSLYADKDGRKKILQIMSINGVMEPREIEVIRRDGSHFFVMVSASEIRDSAGNLLFNMATHMDLTERKKNEEKVRAAALYSRNLIESSLDPLVTINAEGMITDVNLATEHVTGFRRERLIGSEFADYFVESEKARETYNIVFSKGVIKNFPLTILHKNGRTTDVLYNATLFKNEEGIVEGVFAAARYYPAQENGE